MTGWIELPGSYVLAYGGQGAQLTVERFRRGDDVFAQGPDGKTCWLSRAEFQRRVSAHKPEPKVAKSTLKQANSPRRAAVSALVASGITPNEKQINRAMRASNDKQEQPMSNISKAARLVKALVGALEDEDTEKARSVCKQIVAALDGDDDDSTGKPANDNKPATKKQAGKHPFLEKLDDGGDAAARAERNAMRVRMGLSPIGGQPPRAFRTGVGQFQFSVHGIAQEKAARS